MRHKSMLLCLCSSRQFPLFVDSLYRQVLYSQLSACRLLSIPILVSSPCCRRCSILVPFLPSALRSLRQTCRRYFLVQLSSMYPRPRPRPYFRYIPQFGSSFLSRAPTLIIRKSKTVCMARGPRLVCMCVGWAGIEE